MFKNVMQKLALALAALLCFCSYSNAQVSTGPASGQTGNILIIGNGWTGNFSTCTHNVNCWAGSTDTGDIHNAPAGTTGNGSTFYWSGTQETLTNTIAINSALAAAGIQVDGFDYEWVYKNGNANHFSGQPGGGGIDPFEIVVNVYDANGNLFKTYRYDYGTNFANWTYDTGTEVFGTNFLDPSFFGNVEVLVTGQDIAAQAGYWGPEFRADESGLYVNYSANLCYNNPLHDPSCPGYANALFQQQCTANPLFDSACPGYAAAYLIQQCTANPLHDPACPGYATAYYNQQCSLDPLYDKGCTGHLTAQCNKNPLYDPQCPGYAAAYLADRCFYDPLYDVQCTGYQQAYFDQQCELDSQYDQLCPAYLDPDLVDLGDVDPVEEVLSEPDIPVVAELDFTSTVNDFDGEIVVEDQQIVETVEVEDGDGFQQVDDNIEGEKLQMEDDIEKEIAALENEAVEDDTAPDFVKGDANQEDDIEKELAELKNSENSDNKKDAPKPKTKNEKIKLLLAMKAIELTKKLEKEVSLEQNMIMQRQLLALISYVPGFDYNEKKLPQTNFYPPKPTVDHAYARWFLNDPNFGLMEDSQYNFK
jgi:hypothetical protein